MILRDSQKTLCRNILSLFNRKNTSESSKKYLLTGLIPSTGYFIYSIQVILFPLPAGYSFCHSCGL